MKEEILRILKDQKVPPNEISGWSKKMIEEIENRYMHGKKFPKAVRTFLELAGDVTTVSDKFCISDFYTHESGSEGLNQYIKKWADGRNYCIVGYYSQGGFVWFCFLDEGENPPVYKNEYVTSSSDSVNNINSEIKFIKSTDNFYDFIKKMTP